MRCAKLRDKIGNKVRGKKGRYKIIESLTKKGGMGVLFVAETTDKPKTKVVIKFAQGDQINLEKLHLEAEFLQAFQKSKPEGIVPLIVALYNKTKPLLYNESVLGFSTNLYGERYQIKLKNKGDASSDYVKKVLVDKKALPDINWYWAARKNAYGESRSDDGQNWNKAATLSMMWEFSKKIIAQYNSLFNQSSSPSYNGGAWIGGATGIPIIPTQISTTNPDIVIALQATQLANREERVNEVIGSLDLLGTYTYDLEIINSLPLIGGAAENYPTNFTFFTIEDI